MPEGEMRKITFAQAVREGLDQAMEYDANVIVIGEGVPDPKAIFNTTAGLREKYGAARVFDMPLAENGLTGVCIGAALNGMRPVMVHQRIDFALLAMDQLINNAAKWHYMFDGHASVPLVVRMIVGRGWGQGPQHSQSLQSMFAHVPGIKVVMPTTPSDAKGMMIGAIEDNNPVLFIEHRWLHHMEDNVLQERYRAPLNGANVLQQGADITIASFSYMTVESLIAAKALNSTMGVKAEVLDMRSIRPLDHESVIASVRKTGRLVVADAAFRTGSIGADLVGRVAEYAFDALKGAPVCISLPDHPAPTSHYMSDRYYPSAQTIADTVLEVLGVGKETPQYAELCKSIERTEPHDVPSRLFTGPF